MKQKWLFVISLILILLFTGCDALESLINSTPETEASNWWLKGSFDDWGNSDVTGSRHYFVENEMNQNILTYEITNLQSMEYEFVIFNDKSEQIDAPNSDILVSGIPISFTPHIDNVTSNAVFIAEYSSYTITVDITNPNNPIVTLIPGDLNLLPVSFNILADNLSIIGDAFDLENSTSTGIIDESKKTVTFVMEQGIKNGSFGINSFHGLLKGPVYTSPTVEGNSTEPQGLLLEGENIKITDTINSDSIYTLVISIDPTAVNINEKYIMTVTLSTIGTTLWETINAGGIFISAIEVINLPENGTYALTGEFFETPWVNDSLSMDSIDLGITWTFAQPIPVAIGNGNFLILESGTFNIAANGGLSDQFSDANIFYIVGLVVDAGVYKIVYDASKNYFYGLSAVKLSGIEVDESIFDDEANTTPQSNMWWMKGSFDGWRDSIDDGTRHYFVAEDPESEIFTYEITDLMALDYEFVLVDPNGFEWTVPIDVALSTNTSTTFVPKDTDHLFNGLISAEFTSYTIQVDLTDAEAPILTLIPGEIETSLPGFTHLAEVLTIKGDAFTSGWADTPGVIDESTQTVTFEVTMANKNGVFGFSSMDGFLNGVTVESPTIIGTPTTAVGLSSFGDNCTITNPINSDSEYEIVVTINPDAISLTEKYLLTVSLKTVGTIPWILDIPSNIYLVGAISAVGWTDWSEFDDGREILTLDYDIATYTYTATDNELQMFKWSTAANSGWDYLTEYGSADLSDSPITITDEGTFEYEVNMGLSYTITIDYSYASDYETTGIPKLSISITE